MPEVRVDEFALILIGCVILISLLTIFWTMPTEPMPYIEPSSVLLKIPAGRSKSFEIFISGRATNVTMSCEGKIKHWVSFSKNYFNVVEKDEVKVTVSVPYGTEEGIYLGDVIVRSAGGKFSIPVEVQVFEKEVEKIYTRTILLGNFSIEREKASEKVFVKKEFEIFNSLFSRQDLKFEFFIPTEEMEKLIRIKMKIFIEETNQLGNLIILLNEEKIFDRKISGEVEIIVEKEKLKENNNVSIFTSIPFQFWRASFYKIKEIEIEAFYEEVYSKTFYFSLEPYQAQNFLNLTISFVKTNPEVIENLIIKINDQIIYWKKPPLIIFDYTFSKDILDKPIILFEENSITFELREKGKLSAENVKLIINYL